MYEARFDEVLSFHAPGLAPVRRGAQAWHIRIDGSPAYNARFERTFGFYEGLAAVTASDASHHIHPDGTELYATRFSWCGNFQGGRCAVRELGGAYLHITAEGSPAYGPRWRYAGDFRDGVGVVQSNEGRSTHIDPQGALSHGVWFLDLDVFHKGCARARDDDGWTHIDHAGQPLYTQRFAAVEPFYNGQARVERFDGGLEIIDETGQPVQEIRSAQKTALQRLSSVMVGFWGTQVIRAAVDLGVFDSLPGTADVIAARTSMSPAPTSRLLRALWELGLVTREGQRWAPTEMGSLLCRESSSGMADAALHWGTEHYLAWTELGSSLETGNAGFEKLYGQPFFEWLTVNSEQHQRYHRAMRGYAEHDYRCLPQVLSLDGVRHVIDAGGGSGFLIAHILAERTDLSGTLLDLPEVIASAASAGLASDRLDLVAADLFSSWPCSADLVLLARVLHDWNDERARAILLQAHRALRPGGRVALVEFVLPDDRPDGGLLDLNMLTLCGSGERTLEAWLSLANSAGFRLTEVTPLTTCGAVLSLTPNGDGEPHA